MAEPAEPTIPNLPAEGDYEHGDYEHEPSSPTPTSVSENDTKTDKVTIFLKATANAPILKKKNWLVPPNRTISFINSFVRRCLKLDKSESLFVYVNQTFAPSPDQTIKNLYDCYGTDGKLVLQYSISQAWG